MKYNYRFILFTLGRIKPIGWIFRQIYAFAVTRLMAKLDQLDFIESVFLKGSFLNTRFVPIMSDLDFVILGDVSGNNKEKIQKVFNSLNPIFPMLSDYDFHTHEDFEILKTFGGIKFIGVENWKKLKGRNINTTYIYYPRKMDIDIIHEIYFQFEWLFKNLKVRKEGHAYHSLGVQRQYDKVEDLLFYLDNHKENLIVPRVAWRSWGDVSNEEVVRRFNALLHSNEKIKSLIQEYEESMSDYNAEEILRETYYLEELEIIKEGFEYADKMHYFTMPIFKLFYLSGCIDSYLIHDGAEKESDEEFGKLLCGLYFAKLIQGRTNTKEGIEFYRENRGPALELKEEFIARCPISNTFHASYFDKDLNLKYRWNKENLEPFFENFEKDSEKVLVYFDFVPSHNSERSFNPKKGVHYIQVVIPNMYFYPGFEPHAILDYILRWCRLARSLTVVSSSWNTKEKESLEHAFDLKSNFEFNNIGISFTENGLYGTRESWESAISNIPLKLSNLLNQIQNIGNYNSFIRTEMFLGSYLENIQELLVKDYMGFSYLSESGERTHGILDFLNTYCSLSIQDFYWKLTNYESSNQVEIEYPKRFTEKIDENISQIDFGFRKDSYVVNDGGFKNKIVLSDDGLGRPSRVILYFKLDKKYTPGFYSYDLSISEHLYDGDADLKISVSNNPFCQIHKICEKNSPWEEKGIIEIEEDTKGVTLEIIATFKSGDHDIELSNLIKMPHTGAGIAYYDSILDFTHFSNQVELSQLPLGIYKIVIFPKKDLKTKIRLIKSAEVLREVDTSQGYEAYTMEFFKQDRSIKEITYLEGENLNQIEKIDIQKVNGFYQYSGLHYGALFEPFMYKKRFNEFLSIDPDENFELIESKKEELSLKGPFALNRELPGLYKVVLSFSEVGVGELEITSNGEPIFSVYTNKETKLYALFFYVPILSNDIKLSYSGSDKAQLEKVDFHRHEYIFDSVFFDGRENQEHNHSISEIIKKKNETIYDVLFDVNTLKDGRFASFNSLAAGYYKVVIQLESLADGTSIDLLVGDKLYKTIYLNIHNNIYCEFFFVPMQAPEVRVRLNDIGQIRFQKASILKSRSF